MEIKIEKNVPIKLLDKKTKAEEMAELLLSMDIGDSFQYISLQHHRILSGLKIACEKNPLYEYTTRRESDTKRRFWRTN